MTLKTVTFTIDEDLAMDCKINAVKKDISLSTYIREIVTDAISPSEPKVMEYQKSKTLLETIEGAFGSKANIPKTLIVKQPKKREVYNNPRNPNDPWICPDHYKEDYSELKWQDGVLYYKKYRGYQKWRDMEDILYAKQVMGDKGYFTISEKNELMKSLKTTNATISKFLVNIENGFFDRYINLQNRRIKSAKFTAKDGYIYVSGNDTGISISNAETICYTMINCNNREKCISLNVRAYPHLNPYYIRCICENYSHDDLFQIIRKSHKKNAFIENNPSKRRNMIRNSVFI